MADAKDTTKDEAKAPAKPAQRYIKAIEGKIVHLWTEALSGHPDFIECDKTGKPVDNPKPTAKYDPTCANCTNFASKK